MGGFAVTKKIFDFFVACRGVSNERHYFRVRTYLVLNGTEYLQSTFWEKRNSWIYENKNANYIVCYLWKPPLSLNQEISIFQWNFISWCFGWCQNRIPDRPRHFCITAEMQQKKEEKRRRFVTTSLVIKFKALVFNRALLQTNRVQEVKKAIIWHKGHGTEMMRRQKPTCCGTPRVASGECCCGKQQ